MWISEEERRQHFLQDRKWSEVKDSSIAKKRAKKWKRNLGRQAKKRANSELWKFHDKFKRLADVAPRIALLRSTATKVFVYNSETHEKRRAQFDTKKKRFSLKCPCEVCGQPADVRHHIVQLQNGGGNNRLNIMRLCDSCHAEIHPWLWMFGEQRVLDERLAHLIEG